MLYGFSCTRFAWALLTLGCTVLFAVALYFQYAQGMAPCVMCVYQRAALAGVILAGILGWLAPKSTLITSLALLSWFASAIKGTLLAKEHINYQFNPSPFTQCSTVAEFPTWFALDNWLPALFHPSGDCADVSWIWMGLSMPQWLLGIFVVLAVLAGVFIVVRLKKALS